MISVVIPCRSDNVGLWFTVSSFLSVLEKFGSPFEIIPVLNGPPPSNGWVLHQDPRVRSLFAGTHVNSPQAARHVGYMASSGDPVIFADSHVVVPPDFMTVLIRDMEDVEADFMGVGHRFDNRTQVFASRIDWDDYLWARSCVTEAPSERPFRVAMHEHGMFAVRRASYEKAGGYWRALDGFGGEETQLCLKFWLMGLQCWATPRTYHWHWLAAGERRGAEAFREYNFVRNFLLVAAAYSDEEQVRNSYRAFQRLHWGSHELFPMLPECVVRETAVVAERATIEQAGKFSGLRELRNYFHSEQIIN